LIIRCRRQEQHADERRQQRGPESRDRRRAARAWGPRGDGRRVRSAL